MTRFGRFAFLTNSEGSCRGVVHLYLTQFSLSSYPQLSRTNSCASWPNRHRSVHNNGDVWFPFSSGTLTSLTSHFTQVCLYSFWAAFLDGANWITNGSTHTVHTLSYTHMPSSMITSKLCFTPYWYLSNLNYIEQFLYLFFIFSSAGMQAALRQMPCSLLHP